MLSKELKEIVKNETKKIVQELFVKFKDRFTSKLILWDAYKLNEENIKIMIREGKKNDNIGASPIRDGEGDKEKVSDISGAVPETEEQK